MSRFRRCWLAIAAILLSPALAPLALAQDAPPPLNVYGSLPGVEDMAISPSGDTMAMVVTLAGAREVVVLNRDLSVRSRTRTGEEKFRSLAFVGDEALLYTFSQTVALQGFTADQAEISQVLVIPLDGAADPYVLFSNTNRLAQGVFGSYGIRRTPLGWRGYFGAFEQARRIDESYGFEDNGAGLYEVDFATGQARRVAQPPNDNQNRDWLVDADGSVVATFTYYTDTGIWQIINAERTVLAEGRNSNGNVSMVGLGGAGDTVIYRREDSGDGFIQWLEVPLAGGASAPFLPGVTVERLLWDRGSARLLGYLPDDATNDQPVLFDPEMQRRARLLRRSFTARNGRMMAWTDDLGQALVHTSGAGDSGTWIFVDLANRAAQEVGFDRPTLAATMVGPVSMVEYTAADGLAMDGVLTLPPGREPRDLPLIVLPHGGPQGHDEPAFDWWAQAFASRGYAVFQPNFRGSTGRGEAFVRAGFGQWGRAMQTDITDGVAHLAAQGTVDPARACIVGASYGGYAALAGVTVQQGFYRCAVAVAGVSDIGTMYETERYEAGRTRTVNVSLLEELGPRDSWAAVSPRRLAARADAPILLIHGRDDTVVQFAQSTAMADALKDAGKPYRLVELAGEDHWLSRSETRQQMLQATMDFVVQHNPPD